MKRPPGAFLMIGASLLMVTGTATAEPLKLAVTEIRARRGIDPVLAKVVEDFLVDELAKQKQFSVIGRDDILRLLDHEQQKQLGGCSQDACLAEIGGAMGVDQLVAGALDVVGKSVLISLKIIDTRSGAVVARESERLQHATEEDALDVVSVLARRLVRHKGKKDMPILAVTEIQARRGVDPVLARVVEEFIAGEIAKAEVYAVVGRDDIARLMDYEQQKQLVGCEAESCLAEIGGALGASKLLAGRMDRVGQSILISLKLINVKEARVENRESERLRGAQEEDALDAVAKLFNRLFEAELAAAGRLRKFASDDKPRDTGGGWESDSGEATKPVRSEPAPPPGKTPSATDDKPVRIWTWVAAGVAVVALGTGIGLEVVAAGDQKKLDDLVAESKVPGNDVSWTEIRNLRDEKDGKAVGGHVMLGLGGALAVTAVILFFVELPDEEESAAVAPILAPDMLGASVGWRF